LVLTSAYASRVLACARRPASADEAARAFHTDIAPVVSPFESRASPRRDLASATTFASVDVSMICCQAAMAPALSPDAHFVPASDKAAAPPACGNASTTTQTNTNNRITQILPLHVRTCTHNVLQREHYVNWHYTRQLRWEHRPPRPTPARSPHPGLVPAGKAASIPPRQAPSQLS